LIDCFAEGSYEAFPGNLFLVCVVFGFEYVFREIGSVGCVFTFIGGGEDEWTCVDDKSEVIVYVVVAAIGAVCVERDSFDVPILVR
jgi:hypothetical protein